MSTFESTVTAVPIAKGSAISDLTNTARCRDGARMAGGEGVTVSAVFDVMAWDQIGT